MEVCLVYHIDEALTIWEIVDGKNDMKAVWFWALEHGVWKDDVEVSHPTHPDVQLLTSTVVSPFDSSNSSASDLSSSLISSTIALQNPHLPNLLFVLFP